MVPWPEGMGDVGLVYDGRLRERTDWPSTITLSRPAAV